MPNRVKHAKKELTQLSHDFIRRRDSLTPAEIGGYCFDCGKLVYGQQFQCGHWITDASGGALLRYHPFNMNGQAGGCNCGYRQEEVKINYTLKMIEKYSIERVNKLRQLKNKTIKADIIWYEQMIELYKEGNQQKIVDFLEQ